MTRENFLSKLHFIELLAGKLQREIAMREEAGQENVTPVASPADAIERRPRRLFRAIGDTARMNYALDHAFLVERERWLQDEKIRLKRKYQELSRAIDQEIAQCREEQERLMAGIRYSVIAEESPDLIEERASAPTSTISSKNLSQQ
jgi:hypothetical protein